MNKYKLPLLGALLGLIVTVLGWTWTTYIRLDHYSGATHIYYVSTSDNGQYQAYLGGNKTRSEIDAVTSGSTYTSDVYFVDRSVDPSVIKVNGSYTKCTRPRISRDGKAITFYAYDSNDSVFKPFCYIVATSSLVHATATDHSGNFSDLAWAAPSKTPPGISNEVDEVHHYHWLIYQDLSDTHELNAYLMRWEAGSTTTSTTMDVLGNGFQALDPDLDSTPSYLTFVTNDHQVYRSAWTSSGSTTSSSQLVSHIYNSGSACNGSCSNVSIDGSGAYIAFDSNASDLLASGTLNSRDVYCGSYSSGWTVALAYSITGSSGAYTSELPHISGNGSYITFESNANNLAITSSFTYPSNTVAAFLVQRGSPTTLDCVSAEFFNSDPVAFTACQARCVVATDSRDVLFDTPTGIEDNDSNNDIYMYFH
jgi:hypothetical protein